MTDVSTPAVASNAAPAPTGGGAMRTPVAGTTQVMLGFSRVTNASRPKWIKILIYGQAGGGKTTFAGSAADIPSGGDVLLVTAEGGDIVFQDNERILHPDKIDQMRVLRIEQLQKTFEWLQYHVKARDANDEKQLLKLQNMAFFGKPDITDAEILEIDPHWDNRIRRYETVILDSLTDIEAQNMNHIMGLSDKGFDVGDDLSPAGYAEFRKNNNTIQQIARSFRNLPCHLVIICGQRYAKDEMQRFHYTPWLTGQLSTQIQSFVDIVGYQVISNADPQKPDTRRLYVQPQAAVKFDAKCRIASYKKPYFEDPLFADILRECGYLKA